MTPLNLLYMMRVMNTNVNFFNFGKLNLCHVKRKSC